jgi:hypothetical protein
MSDFISVSCSVQVKLSSRVWATFILSLGGIHLIDLWHKKFRSSHDKKTQMKNVVVGNEALGQPWNQGLRFGLRL